MIAKYFKKLENSLTENSHIIEDYILNKQTFTQEKGSNWCYRKQRARY